MSVCLHRKEHKMKEIKILSIGNSFSQDTMEHLAEILKSLGYEKIKLGNLYIGGCSINQHYDKIETNAKKYEYYTNDGNGWICTPETSSVDAIESDTWDWISIQPGTGDGSRATDPESYKNLPKLCAKVRALANENVKLAFTMTWFGEPSNEHPEMVSYNGDQLKMYRLLTEIIQNTVLPMNCVDVITPMGTAVQNARTSSLEAVCRDGYHLTFDTGRYFAGLTFVKALLGENIDNIEYSPEGVDEKAKKIAIESANNAIKTPFAITNSNF